eukprot:447872_1
MALGGAASIGLATVALPAIGFTAGGVAAGSIAATIQSSMSSVAAGSIFASLQSAGAAGFSKSTKALIVGLGVVGSGLLNKITATKKDNDVKIEETEIEETEIDETESTTADTYHEWNTEQLIHWILSVDNGFFQMYEQTIRTSLTQEQVDGSCLNNIDILDIKRWGIMSFTHSKKLLKE